MEKRPRQNAAGSVIYQLVPAEFDSELFQSLCALGFIITIQLKYIHAIDLRVGRLKVEPEFRPRSDNELDFAVRCRLDHSNNLSINFTRPVGPDNFVEAIDDKDHPNVKVLGQAVDCLYAQSTDAHKPL